MPLLYLKMKLRKNARILTDIFFMMTEKGARKARTKLFDQWNQCGLIPSLLFYHSAPSQMHFVTRAS